MTVASGFLLYLFARVSWWALGLALRGAKPRSPRLFFHRPLLGRWSSSSVATLRALSQHGPYAVLPRTGASLSSHLPTCCTRDLESRGLSRPPVRYRTRAGGGRDSLFAVPLLAAAIDPAPNFSAFGAGVELMVFVALFTVGALLTLNWIIKTIRGSSN